MADEVIIVDVVYDTDEAEKNITNLTEDVVSLEEANKSLRKDLKKSDNQLKEEGKNRIELSKQVEKNSESLKKSKKERRDLIKVQKLQANSLDTLKQKNKDLVSVRNNIDLSTKKGRKEFASLNKEISNNTDKLRKAEEGGGNFSRSVGNYSNAIENSIPGVGRITQSVKGFFSLLLKNPLGLIIAALGALIAFLKGSEEGQQKLNIIMEVGSSVLGNFKDILIAVGKAIFEAFENPRESILSFVELLKQNVINRVVGLIELFPRLGEAISLVFKGNFKEAGKVAADAVAKVGLGVEGFTDKAVSAFETASEAVSEFTDELIADAQIAQDLANRENVLRKKTRENLVAEAVLRSEIAEIRAIAANKDSVSSETRLKLLDEAIEKENEILANNQALAAERLKLKEIENDLASSTIEDLEERARLEKELIDLQTHNSEKRRRLQSERQAALREIRDEEAERNLELLEISQKLDEEFDAQIEKELELENQKVASSIKAAETQIENLRMIAETDAIVTENRIATAQQLANSLADIANAAFNLRGQQLEVQKQRELKAVGDNEKAKEEIEKKFAKKRKKLAIKQALISGAQAVLNGLLTQPFFPAGIIAGAAAGVLAGIQVAAISKQQFGRGGQVKVMGNGGSLKSGTFSGSAHSSGGIDLFTGTGQHVANVEGKENFYVINKNASDMINSLSTINQGTGGVPLSKSSNFMQQGGQAAIQDREGLNSDSIRKIVAETVANMPSPVVQVEDITTGITDRSSVKNIAVVA